MIPGIYNLIDGSLLQQLRFDNISNNLANINTNGFKKDNISFNKTLTMKYFSRTDFSPGIIHYTGNKLDVALNTPGFFKIQTSKGVRYTRDGSFTLNVDQELVTRNGDRVLGQNGPIKITGNDVTITGDGQVIVDKNPVDKILVVDFKQPHLLRKDGYSCYVYQGEENAGTPAEDIIVNQNHLEGSNVNPTEEMIKMLETHRAFEAAQKAIQTMDELTNKMVNDPGLLS